MVNLNNSLDKLKNKKWKAEYRFTGVLNIYQYTSYLQREIIYEQNILKTNEQRCQPFFNNLIHADSLIINLIKLIVHQNQLQNIKNTNQALMSCLPVSQFIENLQQHSLSKSRISYSLQKTTYPTSLENRASTNLLQLSSTICGQNFEKEKKLLNSKKKPSSLSPWNLKHEQNAVDRELYNTKDSVGNKILKEIHVKNEQNVQDNDFGGQIITRQNNLQRCCSVFIGQFATNQLKCHKNIKRNRTQSWRITELNKKNEQHTVELNCERHEISERQKSYLYKKDLDKFESRKQSVKVKQLPLSQYELKGECSQNNNNDYIRLQVNYWKFKVHSIRSKKVSKLLKADKQNQISECQTKKKMVLSKKNSLFPEKSRQNDCLIHNPFTRMLYRKYINTISVNPKVQMRHCL